MDHSMVRCQLLLPQLARKVGVRPMELPCTNSTFHARTVLLVLLLVPQLVHLQAPQVVQQQDLLVDQAPDRLWVLLQVPRQVPLQDLQVVQLQARLLAPRFLQLVVQRLDQLLHRLRGPLQVPLPLPLPTQHPGLLLVPPAVHLLDQRQDQRSVHRLAPLQDLHLDLLQLL